MYKKGFYNPTEIVIISYLFLTGIFIFLFSKQISDYAELLYIRLLILLVITLLAWFRKTFIDFPLIQFIRYVFPILLLAFFYKETDSLNNILFRQNLDPLFSRIESLIFNSQPALTFSMYVPSKVFAELMYLGYFSYYLMIILVPMYFYFKDEKHAEQIMFVMINSFLVFYLIFIFLPVTGPQYFFGRLHDVPDGYLFGYVIHWIHKIGEAPTAAFPSSHVSICLILLLYCYQHARKLLMFILPFAVLLILSTVYIRAHYVIDVVAAIIITPLFYWLSHIMYRKLSMLKT